MKLYYHAENRILPAQHGLHAVLNLLADAAIWFKVQTGDLNLLSWDSQKTALYYALRPIDYARHSWDALVHCIQTGTVASYNAAFQKALLWCHDVSGTEALNRYIEG